MGKAGFDSPGGPRRFLTNAIFFFRKLREETPEPNEVLESVQVVTFTGFKNEVPKAGFDSPRRHMRWFPQCLFLGGLRKRKYASKPSKITGDRSLRILLSSSGSMGIVGFDSPRRHRLVAIPFSRRPEREVRPEIKASGIPLNEVHKARPRERRGSSPREGIGNCFRVTFFSDAWESFTARSTKSKFSPCSDWVKMYASKPSKISGDRS
ncbi:hypothetical protein C8R47DRAFT_1199378, partial [Mycena vitilis]